MTDSESRPILERLDRLERENRAMRRTLKLVATAALAVGLIGAGVAAAFQDSARFQKAVEVYDTQSVMRAVLYASDASNKCGLELRDTQGKAKLLIHTNQNDDPYIQFVDDNGKTRIDLGIDANGSAYLVLFKGDGTVVQSFVAPLN